MEIRQIIDEHIHLVVGKRSFEYTKEEFTWEELLATEGALPSDIIWKFYYKEVKESGMFSMKMEDELRDVYCPMMEVVRKRPETDDEFIQRKSRDQVNKNTLDEKDKLEYLRLKAKFEPINKIPNE
jgi:hypothetical protein